MPKEDLTTFCPASPAEWRNWLEKNHESEQSIWLVVYKASTNIPSLTWSEAVDAALCYGWIDSTKKTIDKERYMQYYSKRKPSSTWSKINKDKVAKLIQGNLMAKAGLDCVETAKKNGNWALMDDVEKLIVPEDLRLALKEQSGGTEFYESQSKSTKRSLLYWVVIAKRADTKKKRITEIAQCAAKGILPDHFR